MYNYGKCVDGAGRLPLSKREDKMLLTQSEAAAYLGTTPKSLSVMRSQGKIDIPFVKWGNRIRYEQKDLDAWIESNKHNRKEND